ncbi:hypothetical protein FRB93_013455 [Tulasnella sp. JGI-2019a]|nr:hypothetical protein FRB93_013455 [Tulasnella sp. JGI-2019a]
MSYRDHKFRYHSNGWCQLVGFGSQFNTAGDEFFQKVFLHAGWKALFPNTSSGPQPPPVECLRSKHGHLQVTLGIKENGCSYLLITMPQLLDLISELKRLPKNASLQGPPRRTDSHPPWKFMSLSPISFATSEKLERKWRSYLPKTNKNKKKQGGDTSQANDHYYHASPDMQRQAGDNRSGFEHSRVLYRALHGTEDMSLYLGEWDGKVASITSLAFTTWGVKDDTKVLDMAWSKITLTGSEGQHRNASYDTTHLRVAEYSLLTRNDQRHDLWVDPSPADFPGGTQVLDEDACRHRLFCAIRDILGNIQNGDDMSKPHIIIVHNALKTCEILKACGISTQRWLYGLSTLLRPREEHNSSYSSARGMESSGSWNHRTRDARSRSPPPRWRYDEDRKDRYASDSRYSTVQPKREDGLYEYSRSASHATSSQDQHKPLSYAPIPGPSTSSFTQGARHSEPRAAPIIIIDILDLYNTAMKHDATESAKANERISFRELSMKLGVSDEREGWCAGADAENIYEAWQSLVGSAAVDERGEELKAQRAQAEAAARKKAPYQPAGASAGILDAGEAPGLHDGPVIPPMSFDDDSEDDY